MKEFAVHREMANRSSKKAPSQMDGRAPMTTPSIPRCSSAARHFHSPPARWLYSRQPPQSKITQISNQTTKLKNTRIRAHSASRIGTTNRAWNSRTMNSLEHHTACRRPGCNRLNTAAIDWRACSSTVTDSRSESVGNRERAGGQVWRSSSATADRRSESVGSRERALSSVLALGRPAGTSTCLPWPHTWAASSSTLSWEKRGGNSAVIMLEAGGGGGDGCSCGLCFGLSALDWRRCRTIWCQRLRHSLCVCHRWTFRSAFIGQSSVTMTPKRTVSIVCVSMS
mmetsp:Transcript_96121/g.286878  ORF Transcript_96121/g.286878 Transcript_96121/m.286878 type:complete len:283 (+) Transcript_96121:1315-2163(+)